MNTIAINPAVSSVITKADEVITDLRSQNPNNRYALTEYELGAFPQLWTSDFSSARTDKYSQFRTIDVIHALREEGFVPTNVVIQGRNPSLRKLHNKHAVRMSRLDDITANNGDRPELLIINSHDGSSTFRIMSGFFRCVCSNGLVVGDTSEEERIHHWKKHDLSEVITCALGVAARWEETLDIIARMKGVELTPKQRKAFALQAAKIRLHMQKNPQIKAADALLDPCRTDDSATDLWTTFNVVQENAIKGGRLISQRILRPLGNLNDNLRVNYGLWQLAEDFLHENEAIAV